VGDLARGLQLAEQGVGGGKRRGDWTFGHFGFS
jgi:hypothetical protein